MTTILAAVEEKLELDAAFECPGVDCTTLEVGQDLNRQFGRLVFALAELGVLELLDGEFGSRVPELRRRGIGAGFLGRFLEAWVVGANSALPREAADGLVAVLDRLRRGLPAFLERPLPVERAMSAEAREFLQLALARRRRAAAELVVRLGRGRTPDKVALEVVVAALEEVGRLWAANEISVADEHAATEVCRYSLLRLYDSQESPRPNGRRAVVGCVPGERHELGAELVALHLESRGWDAAFFGSTMPAGEFVRACTAARPDAVYLSVTMPENLVAGRDLVRELRAALPRTGVAVGGRAAGLVRPALEQSGAVCAGSFEHAHEVGMRLVEGHA